MYAKSLSRFLLCLTTMVATTHLISADNISDDKISINYKFIIAIQQGEHAAAEALLKRGADVNIQDGQGFTPLILAARANDFLMVKLLISYNANVNATNNYRDTPLKWSAYNGNLLMAKLLLNHKADLSLQDNDGNTALIDAAATGHAPLVELFIKHKADLNTENIRGDTALSLAKRNGHQKVVEILRQHKAKENDEEREADGSGTENLLARLKKLPIPKEHKKELRQLIKQQDGGGMFNADRQNIKDYIDLVFSLPWGKTTQDNFNIDHARKIFDEDHYGLKEVKEKILDFIATLNFQQDGKAPILCLVGPPGTGKTSIAKSIARALGRKYGRIAVGGVHDESTLRGHVRTYVGARPGRMVQAYKLAQSMNPVIVIDEIDKMSTVAGHHGDPSAAMLEILDPEQNNAFRDNYLEIPLDLSKTLFIATANDLSTIPAPLRDRMQIIELSSYSAEEKLEIAEKHLVGQAIQEAGLGQKDIKISREVLARMIKLYSHEAGVRQIKRTLATLMAKIARGLLEQKKIITLDPKNIEKHLGPGHEERQISHEARVGCVYGLFATGMGGGIVPFEAVVAPRMQFEPIIKLTGQQGLVAQDSGQAALSYVRSQAKRLGFDDSIFVHNAIHIHTTLWHADGPSAGVAKTVCIVSALTKRPVRGDYAMTGEVNLNGRVLSIGGEKEKLLAAKYNGFKHVIFPEQNRRDIEILDAQLKEGIEIVFVSHVDEVLKLVLV